MIPAPRYRIDGWVAEGGGGVVHRGTLETGEPVAIKKLPELADSGAVERFRHEAEVMAALDHPNVVKLLGVDFQRGRRGRGRLCLVQEWVEGITLAELARSGPVPAAAAAYVVGRVLCALDYLHDAIVHRDLAPQNVLIGWDGAVKLADFGIARTLDHVTTGHWLRGTFCYISPEQHDGEPADRRSDLFAVGVILYELLTGRRPFGDKRIEVLANLAERVPLEPPSRAAGADDGASGEAGECDVLAELDHVVARLLAIDPDKRFQTAGQAFEALPARPQGQAQLVASLRALRILRGVRDANSAIPAAPLRRLPFAVADLVALSAIVALLLTATPPAASPPAGAEPDAAEVNRVVEADADRADRPDRVTERDAIIPAVEFAVLPERPPEALDPGLTDAEPRAAQPDPRATQQPALATRRARRKASATPTRPAPREPGKATAPSRFTLDDWTPHGKPLVRYQRINGRLERLDRSRRGDDR